jgi:GntR family transcriptional regulator, arabinose operon transcriptional repressor
MDRPLANSGAVSLPQQIASVLRQELSRTFKAGDKLPTMHVLRERFRVSINTIGAALDMLAQQGVVEKRRGSGVYVRARAHCRRVGILSELSLFDHRISFYFRAVAGHLNQRLRQAGVVVKLYTGCAEPGPGKSDIPTCPQFWEDIAAGVLDGAVVLDTPATDAWYFRLRDCPIPLVGPMTDYDAVLDTPGMVQAGVKLLAAQGCRRLGMLAGQGVADFTRAVTVAGLTTDPLWISGDLDPALRGGGWEQFRELWAARAGRPDGLLTMDDMLFGEAQLAIYELGVRVPEQLRLAVLMNHDASPVIRLPVSTLEVDPGERAILLADMLLARLAGTLTVPTTKLLPFRVGRTVADTIITVSSNR